MARRPNPAKQADAVEAWNKKHPEGTDVSVRRDDGTATVTKTRSPAWLLGGHTAVVMVDGIAGGYLLERVSPIRSQG